MKIFKKATIFCLSLLACLSMGMAVACGGDTLDSSSNGSVNSSSTSGSSSDGDVSSPDEEPDDSVGYVYRIAVQNPTGFGLRNVPVSLYDGETLVASSTTNTNGYAYFRNNTGEGIELGEYTVVLDDLPDGYDYQNADATYETVRAAGTEVKIPLMPTGVIQDSQLAPGQVYKLGDVIHDFTATTSDGTTFNLAQTLSEKDLVVINFWATWCGPCKSEFPVMKSALLQYTDTVDCLAISTTDSQQAVASYKQQSGITFNMAGVGAGNNLADKFTRVGIPQTLMVDRYGVIVFLHEGSIVNLSEWQMLFDTFIGEDYQPTVWGEANEDDPTDTPDTPVYIEPTIPAPSFDEVHATLGTTSDEFTYRWQAKNVVTEDDEGYDKYSWPWIIASDKNGESFLRASNGVQHVDRSYATLYADFTAKADDVLAFDYKIGSELDCDILYVLIDGNIVTSLSGYRTDKWYTCYAYVFGGTEAGEHEITLLYNKDESDTAYDDEVYVRNLRMETLGDGIVDADNALILRQAATVPNTDENATTQFKNYVDIVLNEEDNYYHVGEADGPILFADLWYATQWSQMSVWQLAYYDYCVVEGFSFKGPMEQYAWEANNNIIGQFNMHGLTPVTAELKDLLQIMTEYTVYNPDWDNFDGAYHENEWLEICRYYEPYGDTPQLEDPMKTLTFNAAVQLYEGDNTVNVPFAMTPRGFKYKFIPTTSGVYKVASTGSADTVVFLMDSNQNQLGNWDDKLLADTWVDENGVEVSDGNFEFYWYFEAGETYYLLCTTFLDQVASYNVNIQYEAQTYSYMEMAATAIYSANLVSGELFIPDAVDYVYDANYVYDEAAHAADATQGIGCYRYVDANGNMGSPIYLDATRPTAFSQKISLYDKARADRQKPVEQREFYIRGVDYTERLMQLCHKASITQGKYNGYVVVTQEVYEILYALTVYSAHEGLYNSWLTLCYYEKELGPQA